MNHPGENENAEAAVESRVSPRASKHCAVCGVRLDVHQAVRGEVCADPVCRRTRAGEVAARREREEKAATRGAAFAYRARVAPSLGVADPQALTLAIVPAFGRSLGRLAPWRRKEFRARLVGAIREAFAGEPDDAGAADLAAEYETANNPAPAFPAGGVSCGTCRGHCCRTGGTHAYVDAAVIRRHLADHPGQSWREVMRIFLRKIPAASFEDSCVYHAEQGCALPRAMRSRICNRYECEGLKELRFALAAGGPRPVLVVAARGETIERSTLIDAEGAPMPL